MRQLRHWEKTGLVVPSVQRQISPRNAVRLYSFQDLVELLVVAELRHRPEISLQHIRRVVRHVSTLDFDAPLRELKFATRGKEIYIQLPDGSWSATRSRIRSSSARPLPSMTWWRKSAGRGNAILRLSAR